MHVFSPSKKGRKVWLNSNPTPIAAPPSSPPSGGCAARAKRSRKSPSEPAFRPERSAPGLHVAPWESTSSGRQCRTTISAHDRPARFHLPRGNGRLGGIQDREDRGDVCRRRREQLCSRTARQPPRNDHVARRRRVSLRRDPSRRCLQPHRAILAGRPPASDLDRLMLLTEEAFVRQVRALSDEEMRALEATIHENAPKSFAIDTNTKES